jgi:hypothetical protein
VCLLARDLGEAQEEGHVGFLFIWSRVVLKEAKIAACSGFDNSSCAADCIFLCDLGFRVSLGELRVIGVVVRMEVLLVGLGLQRQRFSAIAAQHRIGGEESTRHLD